LDGWQQQPHHDTDDGDNNEQLDEREAATRFGNPGHLPYPSLNRKQTANSPQKPAGRTRCVNGVRILTEAGNDLQSDQASLNTNFMLPTFNVSVVSSGIEANG
jgi:hypothetical protein